MERRGSVEREPDGRGTLISGASSQPHRVEQLFDGQKLHKSIFSHRLPEQKRREKPAFFAHLAFRV